MNHLREYHLPHRAGTRVTLYADGTIEIGQHPPGGIVETGPPIRIDVGDLADLLSMLEAARLAWVRPHKRQPAPPEKNGPRAVG